MLTPQDFVNTNVEERDWAADYEKAYANRVEDWGCSEEEVAAQYEAMDESEFAEHFTDLIVEELCSCCDVGDKFDWRFLRQYMSFMCGIECGLYDDDVESFCDYVNSTRSGQWRFS